MGDKGLAERIQRISQEFELAWAQQQRPILEEFLQGTSGVERSDLLRQLLLVELAHRRQLGESPAEDEYRLRTTST